MRTTIIIGLASLLGSASATTCEADNCLRAIRAPSRIVDASSACSAYIRSTVTPDTRTYTDYSTISELAQETQYATQTDTIFNTLTVVIKQTATTVLGFTSTSTIYDPALKKRQAQPTIPAYASPCSGAARFSSACSCIGVTGPILVTAPTPSTTITLPTTITYSTQTNVVTAETKSITLTDATKSVTTTDATVTLPGPSATVTITVPYPDKCKNIPWHNGIAFGNWITVDLGFLTERECCLRCFVTPNCIAHVRPGGSSGCVNLINNRLQPGRNPTPQCPLGLKDQVFGQPGSGAVGEGPCAIVV
ncbi:hypothetical protein TWF281_004340 [Arthrobotrys megalospora]